LFHYNGHGVPKPTNNGEIWVFNKNFTQYIPMAISDLHNTMGDPSVYVFDCSNAGVIMKTLLKIFAQNKEAKEETIVLAPCGESETLPTNPDFPADLFTSCLTTPTRVALRYYCMNNKLLQNITMDLVDNIPGKFTDRKTPLGELNWIFTAITDTIAWTVLPREMFQKLFRQDLLLASLFRNFLLAERVMRSFNCTPISYPKLPSTADHPLWQSWDHAVDMCLCQLPCPEDLYMPLDFFESELTEFEVWLEFGNEKKKPPAQLPVLLQVLLSPSHRLRALTLLGKFLDLGQWAINMSLSVGIFPYVLKLLQCSSSDLKKILVFIWAKIISFDKSCQQDLVKDAGHTYFVNVLQSKPDDPDLKALCCFVLSQIMSEHPPGQEACFQFPGLLPVLCSQLTDPSPLVRKWSLLTICKLIEDFDDAKEYAIQEGVHEKIYDLLADSVPDVRQSAIFCLASFFTNNYKTDQKIAQEIKIGTQLYHSLQDGNHTIRKELVVALSNILKSFEEFVSTETLKQVIFEDKQLMKTISDSVKELNSISVSGSPRELRGGDSAKKSNFATGICRIILVLCTDPHKDVSDAALKVFKQIKTNVFKLVKQIEAPIVMKSSWFDVSGDRFSKPLLKVNLISESIETPKIRWRKKRNQLVINEMKENKDAGDRKLEEQIGFFTNTSEIITNIVFHPFDPYLIYSDDKDTISVINWISAQKCNSFTCKTGRITDLKIVNETQEDSLLMTSSATGNLTFWKYFDRPECKVITSFKAVPEALVYQQGPGIITEWQQQTGQLFVSGECEYVKIWDLEVGLCVQNVPLGIQTCVTSMSSDRISGNVVALGCGNGNICIMDKRDGKYSIISSVKEHEGWIIDLKIQKSNLNQIVSGSANGDIKLWDIRKPEKSIRTMNIKEKGQLSAIAIHDYAPIVACGSANQLIKVVNLEGKGLSTIYYHEGFLSQRIGPIASLAFHPYRICLAAGASDSIVSLYTGDSRLSKKNKK
jgi:regulator-associated protein of mTOR